MRFAYKLDKDGRLVEPVFLEGEGPFPEGCREVPPPPGGLVLPRWDGSSWVEGGVPPKLALGEAEKAAALTRLRASPLQEVRDLLKVLGL